jgi:sugar (pentulose or hexulose) kinase
MPNMKDLLLAIDCGTQSLKALVFDLSGNLLDKERVLFTPYFSEHPGWAEQDPEIFWQALCRACRGIWEKGIIPKERIAGASLTSQRGTVINVDASGKPLRPAMLWLDQRKTLGQLPIGGPWGLAFKAARLGETIAYFQAEAEANWIRTYQPDIWREAWSLPSAASAMAPPRPSMSPTKNTWRPSRCCPPIQRLFRGFIRWRSRFTGDTGW